MKSYCKPNSARRRLSRAGNESIGGVTPVPPVYEQRAQQLGAKLAVYPRKQPDVSPLKHSNGLYSSKQSSPLRRSGCPLSKENYSYYTSNSPEKTRCSPPRTSFRSRCSLRPFGYSNCPPIVKVDMKRGSFSYKQKVSTSVSFYGEKIPAVCEKSVCRPMATEPDLHSEAKSTDNRSPSPGLTARSVRFQQMSKRFLLDKGSLQKSVIQLSNRSQSTARKGTRMQERTRRDRMWTPEPLPSVTFVAELESVTKINDFLG